MKILHCEKPMENLIMPSGSPLAPGMMVGLRCEVCGEVVPNILVDLMVQSGELQEQS